MEEVIKLKIRWFGHSFFLVTSGDQKIVFDPFDATVGYPLPQVEADLVIVSHDHFDHNNVSLIKGHPEVIKEPGVYEKDGIKIKVFSTFHDEVGGKKRGKNNVSRLELESMSLIHAGDLGMIPSDEELSSWKPVDVLLLPIGGIFTIDAREAQKLVSKLSPRIVIPMHYRTKYTQMEISPVEPFLRGFKEVRKLGSSETEVTRENLPVNLEVWVLEI